MGEVCVVEGVVCPNTVRWRLEVKPNYDASSARWRIFLEGVAEVTVCQSVFDVMRLAGAPKDMAERVLRVVANLMSRSIAPLEVRPFEPWNQEHSKEAGYVWNRLIGDAEK